MVIRGSMVITRLMSAAEVAAAAIRLQRQAVVVFTLPPGSLAEQGLEVGPQAVGDEALALGGGVDAVGLI